MTDSNTDLAILEGRMAGARLSPVASAVDHHGRRNVVAREVRCRQARTGETWEAVALRYRALWLSAELDLLLHLRDNPPDEKGSS